MTVKKMQRWYHQWWARIVTAFQDSMATVIQQTQLHWTAGSVTESFCTGTEVHAEMQIISRAVISDLIRSGIALNSAFILFPESLHFSFCNSVFCCLQQSLQLLKTSCSKPQGHTCSCTRNKTLGFPTLSIISFVSRKCWNPSYLVNMTRIRCCFAQTAPKVTLTRLLESLCIDKENIIMLVSSCTEGFSHQTASSPFPHWVWHCNSMRRWWRSSFVWA